MRGDEAAALLAEVAGDGWGRVSLSVYETGRLVALAPWLDGHEARIAWLTRAGPAPEGYRLVPTLSTVDALLSVGRAPDLSTLDSLVAVPPPDTIAVEYLVPALVARINERLGYRRYSVDGAQWQAVRDRLRRGGTLPRRMWASLEAFAPDVPDDVQPSDGAVGCSAAATAAWLSATGGRDDARRFLDRLQAGAGGPVPSVTPITVFERAWVLNSLAVNRIPAPVELLDYLAGSLGPNGAPAAPGLPPDADDTAGVLSALRRNGRPVRPDVLMEYLTGDHFACFPEERTPSVSTNAHVLEALSLHVGQSPVDRPRYAPAMAAAREWLRDRQDPAGHWTDKWHASPYYATACCCAALSAHGGVAAWEAVSRAVAWVRETQRADGSWGRWTGTVEETAYAIQILAPFAAAGGAVARGCEYLRERDDPEHYPALWHGKDLYAPISVIRAARLAALAADRPRPPLPRIRSGGASWRPARGAAGWPLLGGSPGRHAVPRAGTG